MLVRVCASVRLCVCVLQDAYEELVMTVGSRRSGLNQNMALKVQYERALQDLADLVDTAQDKIAADQRIVASSVDDVQNLLDKHKVGGFQLLHTVV